MPNGNVNGSHRHGTTKKNLHIHTNISVKEVSRLGGVGAGGKNMGDDRFHLCCNCMLLYTHVPLNNYQYNNLITYNEMTNVSYVRI